MRPGDPQLERTTIVGVLSGAGLGGATCVGLAVLALSLFSLNFGGCNTVPSAPNAVPAQDGAGLAGADGGRLLAVTESSYGLVDLARDGRLAEQVPSGTTTAGIALIDGGRAAVATDMAVGSPSGDLDLIDTVTGTESAIIAVGSGPTGVVVSPDGSTAYVADSGYLGNGNIDVVDLATEKVVSTIAVGAQPTGLALSPGGTTLYVADTALGSPTGQVSVIDTATDRVTGVIGVGGRPLSLAVSPDGSRLYVADHGSAQISVVDTATAALSATWSIPGGAFELALSPDGSVLWVSEGSSPLLSLFGLGADQSPESGAVAVLDAATGRIRRRFAVAADPTALYAASDTTAYVAQGDRPELVRLDARTGRTTVLAVPGLASPSPGTEARR